MERLIWPDYNNCIANLSNSILKYFGAETVGDTLSLADRYLQKQYRNVVVLLLDGMGECIINKMLDEDKPFRRHVVGIYNSVFLSTTVAATTTFLSGLQPCEHSWLGWDCYYPQIDRNVTVFANTIQGTEEPAAPYNVARTFTPYKSIIDRINESGSHAYAIAPFLPPNPQSIEEIFGKVKELCATNERKFIYAYWSQPDGLLHRYGSDSPIVSDALKHIETETEKLFSELEDTLLIVTPDHGHIDNDIAVLQDYPELMECLERLPSLEPRVLNFFVKKGMESIFEERFTMLFKDKFMLIPMDEALNRQLFGNGRPHDNFRGMLGNYLAIATDNLSLFFNEERWLSMHGSVTEKEMRIPLIVFSK